MQSRLNKLFTVIITVILTASISISATLLIVTRSTSKSTLSPVYSKFISIYNSVKTEFLYESDLDKALDEAYKAFFNSLDDNYARYYTKSEYQDMMNSQLGSYVGIGVSIGINEEDHIEIRGIEPQSHLNELGINPGAFILGVEGIMYDGENYQEIKDAILGDAGTFVEVTIEQSNEVKTYQVERREINSPIVISHLFSDTGIGYIRLRTFYSTAVDDFKSHIESLLSNGATSLVIDLRHNTGGQRGICISISDMLLPEGTIMYTQNKRGVREYEYSDASMVDVPYVILVDGFTASASEVLTGAVKDHKTGTIIGTQTYGKGIVQRTMKFSDGSYCQYTYQEYFTPNGNNLHGVGITPDIVVEPTEATSKFLATGIMTIPDPNTDNQLKAAIDFLS